MKKVFKNKTQKYGYYFGMIVRDGSVLCMLFSLLFMCGDKDEPNWLAMMFFLLLFLAHIYGCWRTDYDTYDKEDDTEDEDNRFN